MYVLTNKNNVIIALSNVYEKDTKTRNIILDNYNIAYRPREVINAYNINDIPSEIITQKYCYTENDGFTLNPNYIEPTSTIEEQITDLQLAVAELAGLVAGGNE